MEVFNKLGTDKTVVMAVREGMPQRFEAPGWIDLRIGFLMSISSIVATDDDTTGLAETIAEGDIQGPQDRYWIGVRNYGTLFPGNGGVVFMGYSNTQLITESGDSALVSSDEGIGTTNTNFWRPKNGLSNVANLALICDGAATLSSWGLGIQQHVAQDATTDYATLWMLRLTRPNAESKLITMTMKQGTNSGDVLFTATPTKALLLSNMESFPSTVHQFGPVTVSAVPDTLYWYWPFHNSRLRIHCAGILKVG